MSTSGETEHVLQVENGQLLSPWWLIRVCLRYEYLWEQRKRRHPASFNLGAGCRVSDAFWWTQSDAVAGVDVKSTCTGLALARRLSEAARAREYSLGLGLDLGS